MNSQLRLVVAVIVFNLLVLVGASAYLRNSFQSLDARAENDSENLTKLIAKNIEGQIARVDLALRMVVAEIEKSGTKKITEPVSMTLFNTTSHEEFPPAMRIADAKGLLIFGPGVSKTPNPSIAERDYFKKVRDGQSTSLVVGSPVLGVVIKKWIVPFSLPIKHPDGTFAGLIAVSMPVELLISQSLLKVHKDSVFLLVDYERRAISRITKGEVQTNDLGKVLTGPYATRAVTANLPFLPGAHLISGVDGLERVVAAQRLENAPWFINVGVPWSGYLELWYQDVRSTALMVVFFLVVSNVLAWYLKRGMAQQVKDMSHIEFLAYHDILTELPNRKLLKDRFPQAVKLARREGKKVALLYLDLDQFKSVNDSLGHVIGDAMLKEIAFRLMACVRGSDTVSRQGGDEFLILLCDLDSVEGATPVVLKILQSLRLPILVNDHELLTSASLGIAVYPDDGLDFDTLLKKADVAMYKAKEQGRNGHCFFDEAMNATTRERMELTNALTRGIARNEFVLHYQPQIDLRTNEVIGVEALIRWKHPQFGMVPPGKFIPLAESSGLIVPIGTWVLEEACRQAVEWQASGLPAFTVAVNLSAAQFKRGEVEGTVARVLEQSGLTPHLLELELTESILMTDTAEVLEIVSRLKKMGLGLSIDDFGTGYSSLSYLRSFSVNKLKIDQSFIGGLVTNPEDKAIITAIIQLAKSLKFKTIAEGVETKLQMQQLCDMGCDEAQGYYYARPMPADALVDFLKNRYFTATEAVAPPRLFS
jgi:diguanylate cyclase (GGDEF)-like protein